MNRDMLEEHNDTTTAAEVVSAAIEVIGKSTTCGPSGPLAQAALANLRTTFATMNHAPSDKMWEALTAALDTMERMANGTAKSVVYASTIDPGGGKTQAMLAFLKALLASPDHDGVAAMVCIERLDEIKKLADEGGLPSDSFAAFTADKNVEVNALGCANPAHARILFTTHAMLERRCDGMPFASVAEFHYRGRPRDVRIYDEAILPGRTLTVSSDSIASLLAPMRRLRPSLADELDVLRDRLKSAEDKAQFVMPDLASGHGLDLADALQAIRRERHADLANVVDALWRLFGKVVSVRRDGKTNTLLEYCETLSPDIAPLLVLDASARVRTTYDLWGLRRGGLEMLPSAAKDYSPLTIHVWNEGGGKSSFRANGSRLIEGVAATINSKPDQRWLVIHHLNVGRDVAKEIRALVGPHVDVATLNWGRHNATNKFKDYPNVILCGTLFYPPSHIEALTRLAAKHPSEDGRVSDCDFEEVARGEQRHAILQAVCRSKVRQCDGPRCHPTHAYVIAHSRSGIGADLPKVFPGCRIERWQPLATALKGKAAQAQTYILDAFSKGASEVPFAAIKKHVAVANPGNFAKLRKKIDDALSAQGFVAHPRVRPTAYHRAVTIHFGNEQHQ